MGLAGVYNNRYLLSETPATRPSLETACLDLSARLDSRRTDLLHHVEDIPTGTTHEFERDFDQRPLDRGVSDTSAATDCETFRHTTFLPNIS